jgi:diguanylate cyclase (GGDEF)-like protein/PAS domain S-box-containing protein
MFDQNELFDIFPDPLFLLNIEKAIDYLVSLIDSEITDIETHLRTHPLALLKLVSKVKFLDTNQAAVDFYQAQDKTHLFKELRSRKSDHFQLTFSSELSTFFEDKQPFEMRLNYCTVQGAPLSLKLKVLFLNPDAPSFEHVLLLVNDITEQVRIEKAQDAIYKISEITHEVHDLQELYSFIHQTVNKLVKADNFFIALANYERQHIEFPYTVDEYDERPDPISLGQGYTSHVLKTGKPLLLTPESAQELVEREEIITHGTPCNDWLGVPLITNEGTIGVLTVQTYHQDERLSLKDMEILQFVSTQIAMAIDRKRAEEEVSKFKALSDSANYGITILNEEGKFIYCNEYYAHMHGVEPQDILGRRFPLFQRITVAEEWDTWLQTLLNWEESNVHEVLHKHRDGHQFPVLMHIAPIRNHNETPIFTALTAVDITDQKQQQESLRRYANRLEALHQIDQAILESRSPEQIAEAAVENLQKMIQIDHAGVVWMYDEAESIELLAIHHDPSLQSQNLREEIESRYHELTLPSKINQPEFKNLITASKLTPLEKLLKQTGIRYTIPVPLVANNEIIGLFYLGKKFTKKSRRENLEVVQEVAHILAIALQQSKLYRKIQQLAITDELTGIYNRRQLLKLGRQEFKRARRYDHPLSIIMFDPDNFKSINDSYGHLTGDQVLIEITRRCANEIREIDILGRYGGDEFIIILPETRLEDAKIVAERILKTMRSEMIQTDKGSIMLSISLGVTEISQNGDDQELKDIINRADVALYAAKRGGRNQLTVL